MVEQCNQHVHNNYNVIFIFSLKKLIFIIILFIKGKKMGNCGNFLLYSVKI